MYNTKPILDAAGVSEAMATDAMTEANDMHVSDAATKNDLNMTLSQLGYVQNFVAVRPNEQAQLRREAASPAAICYPPVR